MWLSLIGIAALLLVLVVACGDDEEGEETPTGTPAAAETPTGDKTPTVAGPDEGITDTEIILGAHFALSGTMGAAYAPVLDGVRSYFKYVNAEEGGVCGREIVYKVEDDQYLPSGAVEAVAKLLERDHIFAMIAGLGTAAHAAVWDDLNEKGIPDLWIMSGAHMWAADPEAHPWSVAILPDYYVEGTIIGKYISENYAGKKVGFFGQNDEFGEDELAGLKNGLDPEKNEIVSEQTYEPTDVSVRSQVINLKNSGAEVVHGACIPPGCAQLIKESDRLGWHPQFFIGYVNADAMMFDYASPELMEGVITLQGNKMADWTDDPVIAEHHRIMDEYGNMPAGNFTVEGQLVGELTVEALRATCDNLTRQGLMDAVHTIFDDYQGDIGIPGILIDLSEDDHYGVEQMKLLIAGIDENGKGTWEYFGDIINFREQ
ncbi:MAG: hypothetical protein AMJ77_00130 [Dehalococcoidia bacterium SM23_28_2]|nr:MAG: hypothetical protein AMJ77_00130 [Dehalococcoidia bacterium SM23_28_2]